MMAIDTPEIATTYGALDSDAFADGTAMNAHLLRVLARSSNRLLSKGHQMFNLIWPTEQFGSDTPVQRRYNYSEVASNTWYEIVPPFRISKKPGLDLMTVRIVASISANEELAFQVTTLAAPFAPNIDLAVAPNAIVTSNTTDDFFTTTISDIPVTPGRAEAISLWARAIEPGSLLSTASFGAPNTGNIDEIQRGLLVTEQTDGTLTWGTGSTGLTPDQAGALVVLKTSDGETVATRRVIGVIANTGASPDRGTIVFDVFLSEDQELQLQEDTGTPTFDLVTAPNYALGSFTGAAQARIE